MLNLHSYGSASFALHLSAVLVAAGASKVSAGPLAETDRDFLSRLFERGLFDPSHASRVRGKVQLPSYFGRLEEVAASGWLVHGKGDLAGRMVLDDLRDVEAPEHLEMVSFVVQARKKIEQARQDDGRRERRIGFFGLRHGSGLRKFQPPVESAIWAAWLHRLGHQREARELLEYARAQAEQRKVEIEPAVVRAIARQHYEQAVTAFTIQRDDERALHHARVLSERFPDELKNLPYAPALLADLQRRKRAGRFGKQPPSLPEKFNTWPAERRAQWLIANVDDVPFNAKQPEQLAYVNKHGYQKRIGLLTDLGDAAMPALIDCIELDDRLARKRGSEVVSMGHSVRVPKPVREVAFRIAERILQFDHLDPTVDEADYSVENPGDRKQTVKALREYWRENGHLPYEARLVNVLANSKAHREALREATRKLTSLASREGQGFDPFGEGPASRNLDNIREKLIEEYRDPTVAETILSALDRDLAAGDDGRDHPFFHWNGEPTEQIYLGAIVVLSDRRIVPELRKRFRDVRVDRSKALWARACQQLGDEQPVRELADQFAAGKIVPAGEKPDGAGKDKPARADVRTLYQIVRCLSAAETPAADRALWSLARNGHPFHQVAVQVLSGHHYRLFHPEDDNWCGHPYFVLLLRDKLDDLSLNGTTYKVDEDSLSYNGETFSSSRSPPPEFLRSPVDRVDEVMGRTCDDAAILISECVVGCPPYHPLLRDADKRLAELRAFVDRHGRRLRALPKEQTAALRMYSGRTMFAPAIGPLDRAATAEDVKSGRAIFRLDGKGRPARIELPASARWLSQGEGDSRVLVVQAEVDADGVTHYGIIAPHQLRKVTHRELADIRPLKRQPK